MQPEPVAGVFHGKIHVVAIGDAGDVCQLDLAYKIKPEQLIPGVVQMALQVKLARLFRLDAGKIAAFFGQLGFHRGIPPDDQILRLALLGGEHRFQQERGIGVVVVQKGQIFPPGPVHAVVASGASALVFLVDHHKAGVGLGVAVADGAGAVRAAVVHQDALPIGKGLGGEAVQAAGQIFFRPVYGNHDADLGHKCSLFHVQNDAADLVHLAGLQSLEQRQGEHLGRQPLGVGGGGGIVPVAVAGVVRD